MNGLRLAAFSLLLSFSLAWCKAQESQPVGTTFRNPILPGFNPDPSICRVGDDYYLVTSSFVWFPGIPIYHSKDLVNWELFGHGISRASQVDFTGMLDKDGIWAATIRYHNGLFYLVTTAHYCGGNFYITASNPAGPWSDPVWLKDAPGIDASLTWDKDGTCYYTGNDWNFQKAWSSQCALWGQQLDLIQKKLVGERTVLSYGHAANAGYAEGPHIYPMGSDYLLLAAEGGTDTYHAITAHHSSKILGKYTADKANPVLSHRQLGKDYPIQAVGHGDLVQTQRGEWWAVVLGKRLVDGEVPLSRETFLCKVDFESGTPLFNVGFGRVLAEQTRPDLPWTPVLSEPVRDYFSTDSLSLKWHTVRTPKEAFYRLSDGNLYLAVRPQVIDSLVHSSVLLQRLRHFQCTVTTKLDFQAVKPMEQAGLIIYRNNDGYYQLLKEKSRLVLVRKADGRKELVASVPFTSNVVYLRAQIDTLEVRFSFAETASNFNEIGSSQSLKPLCESSRNKFNGPGVGMYATSNGVSSKNRAVFDWFDYEGE
jgi:alpha-N-arabinofuranosidase